MYHCACDICPEDNFRAFLFMERTDQLYMQKAIRLAEKGKGWVNPNPLVGAVIVKAGRIIGEGWHERYGGLHAERNAFCHCTEDPTGATMYVTLEPCCHYGKTPPCTEAVISHRIARVVVGMTDPNPLVAGKGISQLREAGIEVVAGIEEEQIREQNKVFLKYITTGRPWVAMKTAMTLDGKIATYSGDSKWVTGEEARKRVHDLRRLYTGILVGIGTVLADDPLLNCRLEEEVRQPVRIIADSHLRIPEDSQIVRTAGKYPTLLAYTGQPDCEKIERLKSWGIELVNCREKEGHIDLEDLTGELGKRNIDAVLLEGGGELNGAFLKSGLIDEVYAFIAPKLVGGKEAKTTVEGQGISRMNEAVQLQQTEIEKIGEDILISGKIKQNID